jgi:hypothetical protein
MWSISTKCTLRTERQEIHTHGHKGTHGKVNEVYEVYEVFFNTHTHFRLELGIFANTHPDK